MSPSTATKTSYHVPVGPIHPALKEPVCFEFESKEKESLM